MWKEVVGGYTYRFIEKVHGNVLAYLSLVTSFKGDKLESALVVLEIVHSTNDGAENVVIDDLSSETNLEISEVHIKKATKILLDECEEYILELKSRARQFREILDGKETE
jgi:hypothetical protein